MEKSLFFNRVQKHADERETYLDVDPQKKKQMVINQIGTKKSKNIYQNQINRNIGNQDLVDPQELNQHIKGNIGDLEQQKKTRELENSQSKLRRLQMILPEFNASAKNSQSIFSLDSFIS